MTDFFPYGDTELKYLSQRDPKIAAVITQLGKLDIPCYHDLFDGFVQIIIAQQISSKAQAAIFGRLKAALPEITPEVILATPEETFKAAGVSARKMSYILGIAQKIVDKEIDLEQIREMNDEDAIAALCQFKGIGEWTAKILLVMALHRKNVSNPADLSVLRGLRMLYRHRAITPRLFNKYHRLYSPYNSVAMFYLYRVSDGDIAGLVDLGK